MAIVRQSQGSKWIPVAGAVAAVVVAAVWWTQTDDAPTSVSPQAASAASAAEPVSAFEALQQKQLAQQAPPADLPSQPPAAEQIREAQTALQDVNAASQQLASMAMWKPLSPPIKERPPFASVMEWQMLKGVADRQPDPQAELLRLANFLRYTKLLEKWQDFPASGDAGLRQALARQLLDELPTRVRNGEVDAPDASRQAPAMLRDAYSTSAERDQAAKRLSQAVAEAQQAFQATQTSPSAP